MSKIDLDELCVNSLRTLSMDMVQKANSGHPGAPMGFAAPASVLFTRVLKHNPRDPSWPDRDRFVLSAGHASALLYSLLYLTGYDLALDDLKNFRQWGSLTPGHPEYRHTKGVETTTGPLGQGVANAVGMAMAERFLASRFNRPGHPVVDHYTYVVCGDGCMMEGISSEAASLAGHLGLAKLICLYDDNGISIEGKTDITFTEDVAARFTAYKWQVIKVADGTDLSAVAAAIDEAKEDKDRPCLIMVKTHIGHGSPARQDSPKAHGEPLGAEEILITKKNLNWPYEEPFTVPDTALSVFRGCVEKGQKAQKDWEGRLAAYKAAHPEPAAEYEALLAGKLPDGWDADLPFFGPETKPVATRAASGKALNAIAAKIPTMLGGSADLAPSNNTIIAGTGDFEPLHFDNRNIRFGVREHAMTAITSGMSLHGGVIPYCATFLVFSDYMRPAIRVAALMGIPAIYVLTHDSVAVGEDGPTHQPVEHVASLRIIPQLTVIRPADANETVEAWKTAVSLKKPVALILSRQNLPVFDRTRYSAASGLSRGAYVMADTAGTPDVILIGTGSEVALCVTAADKLAERGVKARVVSMPSWELFAAQDASYRESVLPASVTKRLAVEAGVTYGWERFTGSAGKVMGIDHFGASAPGNTVLEKFGFTAEKVFEEALKLAGK